jgi:hypothetical protein
MRIWRHLLALSALLAAPSAAQNTAPAPLMLEAGTAVPLVTLSEVSSKLQRQGDRFDLEVSADVMVDGQVAIPRGARAVGEVTRHAAKASFGKPGKLEVRLLHVIVGDRRIRLDGAETHRGKGAVAPVVAASVISAAIGSLIKGKHASIPAGTPVTGYVHRDIALVRAN